MSNAPQNHILKGFIHYIYKAMSYIEVNDTLSVDSISAKDNFILKLNKQNTHYYCLELAGAGNTETFLGSVQISQIFDNFKSNSDSKIINVLIKNGQYQKNLLFSPSISLLNFIEKNIGGTMVKDLDAIVYLYDLFQNNNYFIKNKKIISQFNRDDLNYPRLSHSFNGLVKDAVYKNFTDTRVFQGFKINKRIEKTIDLSKIFMQDFTGVLFNIVDFSKDKVLHLINERKKDAFWDGESEPFKNLAKEYNSGNLDVALFNSTLFLNKGDLTDAMNIGACIGVDFVEKFIDTHKYIKLTPLLARDTYFDMMVDKKFIDGFFGICHKKSLEKNAPAFYAKDIHGAFFNYAFDSCTDDNANKSSDFAIIGVKGSGKTTFFNGLLSQTLNYNPTNDKDKLETLGSFEDGISQNKIRYFDIKKSGKLLIDMINEEVPDKVNYVEASLNSFRFNPVNIKNKRNEDGKLEIDRDELTLNILLMSIMIESKNQNSTGGGDGTVGLGAMEKTILSKAIIEIYEDELFEYEYILNINDTHPVAYNKLLELGYTDNQQLNEVSEKEFDHLKVPKLNTLIKHVKGLTEDGSNKTLQNAADSLLSQLILIDSMTIFSEYDRFNYNDVNILHIDFDPIKDLTEYIPIFLSLFLKLYRNDKLAQDKLALSGKRKERPYITFVFEEAKNVTEQPSFKEFLAKVSNEARSYRIKLGFVTQFVSHIPSHILKQISNKFFLFPSKNQKEALIQEINDAIGINPKTIELMRKTDEYGVVIVNEHDSSSFRLTMSQEEIELFGQEQ